jgi:hypothetical protein
LGAETIGESGVKEWTIRVQNSNPVNTMCFGVASNETDLNLGKRICDRYCWLYSGADGEVLHGGIDSNERNYILEDGGMLSSSHEYDECNYFQSVRVLGVHCNLSTNEVSFSANGIMLGVCWHVPQLKDCYPYVSIECGNKGDYAIVDFYNPPIITETRCWTASWLKPETNKKRIYTKAKRIVKSIVSY